MVDVTIPSGQVRGVQADGVVAFHGVRYAQAARFEAPGPPARWTGVRHADRPGPAAPQNVPEDADVPDMAVAEIDEDCLNTEIWTPDPDGSRPVLVWVPGGRYQIGGAGLATYDGSRLAADGDLVVVGVNARLGVLGYLADQTVPSNLGLRDLVAALGWIREEIGAFGGDATRITVVGESAGAGALAHLLAVPDAAAGIAGAVLLSGAPAATLTAAQGVLVRDAFLRHAAAESVDDLRDLPLPALLAAQAGADAELLASVGMMPFHPVLDPDFLPRAPLDAARTGSMTPVPLVVGTTAQEMELFRDVVPDLPAEFAVPFLADKIALVLDDTAGAAAAPTRAEQGWAEVDGDLVEAIADTDLHVPAGVLADAHSGHGIPVWRCEFAWRAPGIGAAHAIDLPFLFGTLDVSTWASFVGATGERADAAARLSTELRTAVASFCHDGVPTSPSVGPWPVHDAVRRRGVRLAERTEVVEDLHGARHRAWTEAR